MKTDLSTAILTAARKYQLSPALIAALIHVESGGDTGAFRFEPRFFESRIQHNDKLPGHFPPESQCTRESELILRASSLGPCQVLGETAREMGYAGLLTTLLSDPLVAVDLGARYLAHLIDQHGTVELALKYYNGSAAYPPKVLAVLNSGEAEHLYHT